MTEWITHLWEYEIQVVPVLLAMLLIEVPTGIRRRRKFFYVPIYFSVFPLRELNADLAYYLGENYMLGGETDEDAAERLRARILRTSVISIALSALVVPAFAGYGSAFFLPSDLLYQFVLVFLAYNMVGISRAIVDFPSHAVASRKNTALLVLTYVAYLGVAAHMIVRSFRFARPHIEAGDVLGLLSSTSDVIFSSVVLEFLVLALLTRAFTTHVMDRKLRRENLSHIRGHDTEAGGSP